MNSPANPTVSAVIPVYNGETFVAEAIASVLEQTHRVLECVVVDDGSSDRTAEVVTGFGDSVRYIRQDNAGVSTARNHGARAARGELVAFLDHDDVWLPEKLERQVELLAPEDERMVLCAIRLVDGQLSPIGLRRLHAPGDLLTGLLTFDRTEVVSCGSTGVLNRNTFLALGGFDPALSMSADWDLLVRMLLGPGVAYVDEPLSLYRHHGSNMSRGIRVMEHDMVRAFDKAFDDPRLPGPLRERRNQAYARLYRMLAGSYLDAGDRHRAVEMGARAISRDPSLARPLVLSALTGGRRLRAPMLAAERSVAAAGPQHPVAARPVRHSLKSAYFEALAAARVDTLLRRVQRAADTVLILNFHRVTPEPSPFWPAMTPGAFTRLIGYLTSTCEIVSLPDLTGDSGHRVPRVVLSFDDGYRDFLEYALPVLDRQGLRANQNVIVESVETGRPPWIVRLVDALNAAPVSRVRELAVPGFGFRLDADDELSKTRYGTLLTGYLKNLAPDRRAEISADVEALLSETDPERWTPMMSRAEVAALAGLHDIGAHSYSHESMAHMGGRAFDAEIDRCAEFFGRENLPLRIFAFPNGSHHRWQIDRLQARGVEHVLLVGERPAATAGGVHTRITMYGDTDAELRIRALGHRPALPTHRVSPEPET